MPGFFLPDPGSESPIRNEYEGQVAASDLLPHAAVSETTSSSAATEAHAASSGSCSLREEARAEGPELFRDHHMGSSVCLDNPLNHWEHLFLEAMGYEA